MKKLKKKLFQRREERKSLVYPVPLNRNPQKPKVTPSALERLKMTWKKKHVSTNYHKSLHSDGNSEYHFSFLKLAMLPVVSKVCKEWHELLKSEALWRSRILDFAVGLFGLSSKELCFRLKGCYRCGDLSCNTSKKFYVHFADAAYKGLKLNVMWKL